MREYQKNTENTIISGHFPPARKIKFSVEYTDFKQARKIKHRVLDFLLSKLENKQVKKNGALPFILHPQTARALRSDGLTAAEIESFENSIIRDAEYMKGVEVYRSSPHYLFRELEKLGRAELIPQNRIVTVPGAILNALISAEVSKRFTDAEIMSAGCFVKIRDYDIDGKPFDAWRLDVEPHLSRSGFMVPETQAGFITGLKVFRHFNDNRPFLLRARVDFIDYTMGELKS